ncbi:MAG: zinc ABC transporter substrate-binding protein [Verrucomicrobia bacterium]|nr:zinc ABC transporter substrate-binding protein [Verrucomicrobiota bacterium]
MKWLFLFVITPVLAFSADRVALVSMAPYVGMVKELTGDQVKIELLVPAGFSAHTYEPTPKQILNAAKASIWFTVQEPFEVRALQALTSENPKLVLVDLRQGLELIGGHDHDHGHGCSCSHGADTHIWMSPKMMQVQVNHMAAMLKEVFPELSDTIDKNRPLLVDKLKNLDSTIRSILEPHKGEVVFVAHPAYGYFCREYGLTQQSIEFEGKDPTPKHIYSLVKEAKDDKISTIFTQNQYSTKAAELVAKEVGAKLVMLDPYSEDYFTSMKKIADSFAEADNARRN